MSKEYSNIDKTKGEQCELCKCITMSGLFKWGSKQLCRDCYERESVKDMGIRQ